MKATPATPAPKSAYALVPTIRTVSTNLNSAMSLYAELPVSRPTIATQLINASKKTTPLQMTLGFAANKEDTPKFIGR